ncbi:MAG TPA: thermonuclease family protein [Gemmatimonadaceae bacterium]|nr:thermonuclease family protein [Gemmatimonadaceae bacterium]
MAGSHASLSGFSLRIAVVAVVGTATVGIVAAQAPVTVWVNTRSGVYHCGGTRDYGRTTEGRYLSETEARRRGYRANGGRACGPLPENTGDAGRGMDSRPLLPDTVPTAPVGDTVSCLLTRVVDGDTIECAAGGHVRLIGVDTPEDSQEPFATSAAAALAALLPGGALVLLETDAEPMDQYDRTLAYVWYEGQLVNWQLVRYGWAVSLRYAPNVRYAELFDAAEIRARGEVRGLWSVNGFQCRPADRRRHAC